MGGMPLVPTTQMADASKYSVLGNHWPGEQRDHCLKLRPHLNFVPCLWSRFQDTYFLLILRLQTRLLLYTCDDNKPFFVVLFKRSFVIHLFCQIIYSVREINISRNTKLVT